MRQQHLLDLIKAILHGEQVDDPLIEAVAPRILDIVTEEIALGDALLADPVSEKQKKFAKIAKTLSDAGLGPLGVIIAKRIMGDDELGGGTVAELPPQPKSPSSGHTTPNAPSEPETEEWAPKEKPSLLDRLRRKSNTPDL